MKRGLLLIFALMLVVSLSQNVSAGISSLYPGDIGIGNDPRVLFHDNFEHADPVLTNHGWQYRECSGCFSYESNSSVVNHGNYSLKDTATKGANEGGTIHRYISGQDDVYVRYYIRFKNDTGWPAHMGGIAANDGSAGSRPAGNQAFWSSLEPVDYGGLDSDYPPGTRYWMFYTYWQEMHSWQNIDGSGTSFYGNIFTPYQTEIIQKDRWYCIEARLKANTPNQYDGEQVFWVNNQLVGNYSTNSVNGSWIREKFFTFGGWVGWGGQPIISWPGYNWRTISSLKLNRVDLEWWFNGIPASYPTENIVYFDDFVVATDYIGCIEPLSSITCAQTDVNDDLIVNIIDLALVIYNQGQPLTGRGHLDIDSSGFINFDDVNNVISNIGQTC